ncbi:Na+/H+ antiporter subunit G1, partial [Staphylococcus epidermidis]|uniref:Na+/H+ antiporter subunit G1 n=1 Tax=Staphylococcus epidermidis TaxID=1282 RepID=UPI0037DA2ADC
TPFPPTPLIPLTHLYSTPHPPPKPPTFPPIFLLFPPFLYFIPTQPYLNIQLIIPIIFLFITPPLSTHLIIKPPYNIKTPYTKHTKI